MVTFSLNLRCYIIRGAYCRISQLPIPFVKVLVKIVLGGLRPFNIALFSPHQIVKDPLGFDFCVFAKTKVREFDVPAGIQQHIIWLEITVDVLHLMDRIEGQQNLSGVKLSFLMSEDVLLHEQIHEVSSRQVLHNKVQVVRILKRTLQTNYPRVIFRVGQHIPFFARLHHLVLKDHLALL